MHYDVTIGEGALLDSDAFLLKGEQIAPHEHWRGNPAGIELARYREVCGPDG